MTGRRAYEMFTRSASEAGYYRDKTQHPERLLAWDDLHWADKDLWRRVARQVDNVVKRSIAARA